METNLKYQIAALCFYVIIVIQFFSSRRLNTRPNKYFKYMLYVGSVNLVFDILTVCLLTNIDKLNTDFEMFINRFSHNIFIISLNLFIMLLALFVRSNINRSFNIKKIFKILFFMPTIVSTLASLFLPLYYYCNGNEVYSYGPATYTIYISIGIYLIFSLLLLSINHAKIPNNIMLTIFMSIIVECIIAFIQMLAPAILISGLGIAIMISFLYVSLVNPSDYVEYDTDVFNKLAFNTMIKDHIAASNNINIAIITIDNFTLINSQFGIEFSNKLINKLSSKVNNFFELPAYHIRSKCIAIITKQPTTHFKYRLEDFLKQTTNMLKINSTNVELNTRALIVNCPSNVSTTNELSMLVDLFLRRDLSQNAKEQLIVFNNEYSTLLNRNITIEQILRKALTNDGIDVFYQPIYSTVDKNFHSAEALVRLKDTTTLGYISPEEFVGIAEKNGLIDDLGRCVFEKVCQFMKRNQVNTLGINYIEVNLSVLQCMNSNLSKSLINIIKAYQLPASMFNLELTESGEAGSNNLVMNNINHLIEEGCAFSMDDYGTGYSNLSQIANMPYSIIKLDKSLIWPFFIDKSEKAGVILKQTISMVRDLGIQIVAEGVETKEQADSLTDMGVEYLQGYYFSKPISENAYLEFLKAHR